MQIKIHDDKKQKWQSFEATCKAEHALPGGSCVTLDGCCYGADEAEAKGELIEVLTKLKEDIEATLLELTPVQDNNAGKET
jgi:hypothetical protein